MRHFDIFIRLYDALRKKYLNNLWSNERILGIFIADRLYS